MQRPDFSRHKLTVLALARLSKLAKGESISYEELQRALQGRDPRPQQEAYNYVRSAREILLRQGVVIWARDGEGLWRLTDSEMAARVPIKRRKEIRSRMKKTRREIASACWSALSREEQARISALSADLGIIEHLTNVHYVQDKVKQISNSAVPPPPPPGIPQ